MDFDQKARILSELRTATASVKEWDNFRHYANLGLPFAHAHTHGMVTLKESGRDYVEDAYQVLLTVLDIPDRDYTDLSSMFDLAIANGAKPVSETSE